LTVDGVLLESSLLFCVTPSAYASSTKRSNGVYKCRLHRSIRWSRNVPPHIKHLSVENLLHGYNN
jgi:hypothetical protein